MSEMPAHLWTYRGRPLRVIDGDTISISVDLGFGISKASADNHFRIQGVNCPELHGATREAGLAAALFTKDWLADAAGDWPLVIQTQRLKSGEARTFERWVAAVWRAIDGASLADALIASGHAVASHG